MSNRRKQVTSNQTFAARDLDGTLTLFVDKPQWDNGEWIGAHRYKLPTSVLWEISPGECYEVTFTAIGEQIP